MYCTNSQAASCAPCSAKAFMKKFHPPRPLTLSPPSPAGSGATPIRAGSTKSPAPARAAAAGRRRCYVYQVRLYEVPRAGQAVHVRPIAAEDRVPPEEGRLALGLGVGAHRLRRDAVGNHAVLGLEARDRLGAVDDDLARVVRVEHLPAVAVDELEAVDRAALVLGALEDEAELRALVLFYLVRLLLELVPRIGRAVQQEC